MIRRALSKVAIGFVCGAGFLAVGVPMGLYLLGLSNIEGRPEPPTRRTSPRIPSCSSKRFATQRRSRSMFSIRGLTQRHC
jgi:hypothetical protein